MNAIQSLLSLLEGRADYVAKNFGEKLEAAAKKEGEKKLDAAGIAAELEKASEKHIVWVARMYIAGQFKLEDIPRMKGELEKFDKYKSKLEKKDLNAYKNLDELYDATEKLGDEEEKKGGKDDIDTKAKDATWLIRSKDYMALIPKTQEASCKYGAGTKWCTAATGSHNFFQSYNSRGDLIIIIAKFGDKWRKFQFHFESGSFMDERDTPAKKEDIKVLSKFPEHIKLIHMLIDKYHPEDDDD